MHILTGRVVKFDTDALLVAMGDEGYTIKGMIIIISICYILLAIFMACLYIISNLLIMHDCDRPLAHDKTKTNALTTNFEHHYKLRNLELLLLQFFFVNLYPMPCNHGDMAPNDVLQKIQIKCPMYKFTKSSFLCTNLWGIYFHQQLTQDKKLFLLVNVYICDRIWENPLYGIFSEN